MCKTTKSLADDFYKKTSGKPVAYCKPCSNKQRSAFRIKARLANPKPPTVGFRSLPAETQQTLREMVASNETVAVMSTRTGVPRNKLHYYKLKNAMV
jgi:hypothetical protein